MRTRPPGTGATCPMTVYPHSEPLAGRTTQPQQDQDVATHDDSPRIPAGVPITVWRLDDRDGDQPTTQPPTGLPPRLAQRLVLIYTRHGDAVVDFDHDPNLHSAAAGSGRSYVAVASPANFAELDQLSEPITLIVLKWPRGTRSTNVRRIADLFTACQLMATGDVSVIAAVRPNDFDITFADHERVLRAAADSAGFTHILQIVAVSALDEGDQFLYYANETEAERATNDIPETPGRHVFHIDLLVFRTPMRRR